jgi:hypothetical protein
VQDWTTGLWTGCELVEIESRFWMSEKAVGNRGWEKERKKEEREEEEGTELDESQRLN